MTTIEVGIEAELKYDLAHGMLALVQGNETQAATIANDVAARAEATNIRLYVHPAERLLAAVQAPPPVAELARMMWVRT